MSIVLIRGALLPQPDNKSLYGGLYLSFSYVHKFTYVFRTVTYVRNNDQCQYVEFEVTPIKMIYSYQKL